MTRSPWTLTMPMVLQRRETYLVSHYIGLHFTIASLAIGTAGVTAALLLADDALPGAYPVLFGFLWATSVLATITAFGGATVGAVVLPSRLPAIVDLILPLLIAIIEFLLFAILTPQAGSEGEPRRAVIAWFFLMGGFGALAAFAILRVRVIFGRARCDPDIDPHVTWYRGRLLLDACGAATAATVGFVSGIVHLSVPTMPIWISCAITTLLACLLVGASIGHGKVSSRWQTVFDDHLHTGDRNSDPTPEDPLG